MQPFRFLVVISVELETFPTFFDAIYWATVSLTTVGYGDIFAVSAIGRVVTMLSAVLGIAIVALPAGIIMAGYMDALNESKQMRDIKDQRTNEEFIREAQKLSDCNISISTLDLINGINIMKS